MLHQLTRLARARRGLALAGRELLSRCRNQPWLIRRPVRDRFESCLGGYILIQPVIVTQNF
jgi:hypothetical protein